MNSQEIVTKDPANLADTHQIYRKDPGTLPEQLRCVHEAVIKENSAWLQDHVRQDGKVNEVAGYFG